MMKSKTRGRPPTGRTVQRYQVTLPPAVEKRIRKRGNGSLSAGIIELATAIDSGGARE